ncbi:hypothetical protein BB559_002710 [Furculomyces boomerangus]|uniref:Uncharacterized protein n=1 Tax=Furculomyces boomerangus TaxID=61424 RepID=A0A2T9YT68_9FUNG|nr:hypothetical protein BB559_002710 [Furculomyces boomerangus]
MAKFANDYCLEKNKKSLWHQYFVYHVVVRSTVCEMHSGFNGFRANCPAIFVIYCEFEDRFCSDEKPRRKQFLQTRNSVTLSESAQGNVNDEGFLFGEYGIVDAFFTSTVFRIVNYSLPCENEFAKKYVETTKNQSWLKNGSSWQLKRTVIMNQTRNPSFKHLSFIIKQMLLISLDCLLNKVNFATFLDKVCKRIEL